MNDFDKSCLITVHLLRESKASSLSGRISSCGARLRENVTSTTHAMEEPVKGENAPFSGCMYGHAAHQRPLESDVSEGPPIHSYMLPGHVHLTKEQKNKVEQRVNSIKSKVPIYVTTMIKINVGSNSIDTIVFDRPYVTEYLPGGEQTLMLMRRGTKKKWKVKMTQGSGDMHILTLANEERERLTVTVDIIHHRAMSPLLDCYAFKVKQEPDVLDDSEGPNVFPLCVVLSGTYLIPALEKIAVDKVMSIQSKMPVFVATMNQNIIGSNGIYTLDFSALSAVPYLPAGKEQTSKLHRTGWSRSWSAEMHDRRMLDGELCEFIRDNRLEIGDICLFELTSNERLTMTVHIIYREQYCVALSAAGGLMMTE